MASSFTLGVPLMDEDHARLESLLQRVQDTDDKDLPSLLGEVECETRAHFGREEDLMRSRQVPILGCHVIQHHLFLSEFALGHAAAKQQNMTMLRHFLGNTLPRLLADHVNTVDRVTAGYLSLPGTKAALAPASEAVRAPLRTLPV